MGVPILLAVIIAAVFLFTERIAEVAAIKVGFPGLAVWVPNVIFIWFRLRSIVGQVIRAVSQRFGS